MPESWKMPEVIEGDMVYWYMGGVRRDSPRVGVVTKVHRVNNEPRQISINLFQQNTVPPICMGVVRHIDDPDLNHHQRTDQGAWDHHPRTQRIMALEKGLKEELAAVERLRREMEKFQGQMQSRQAELEKIASEAMRFAKKG